MDSGIGGSDRAGLSLEVRCVPVVLPGQCACRALPPVSLGGGRPDQLGQPLPLGVDEGDRPVGDQPADRFPCGQARADRAPVRAVALERRDELLACVVEVVGYHVQGVPLPAAGHTDVDARRVQRVTEDRVRRRRRHALCPVGGRGVGEVCVLGDVRGGEPDGVRVPAVSCVGCRPDLAGLGDLLDAPGLPVRDA
ncbi:hypothetical protein ACPPVS_16740 [Cellulomonas sp. McL0617]|uniref:hypothetical protein n=1 Tax=Cellulomonas sp. McL0617 TaxID=3415675 RepID=UPI003CFB0024